MARPFYHPAVKDITIDGVLYALSDSIRRKIMEKLQSADGMNCSKSCSGGVLPPSTISHHYKVLRDAGLIRSKKKGVEVINTVRVADIEKRFPGLLRSILQHEKQGSGKQGAIR